MSDLTSHRAIILSVWGGATALAEAIGEKDAGKVSKWLRADNIPGAYFAKIAAAALLSGRPDVTADLLSRLAKPRRPGSGRPRARARTHEEAAA